MFINIKQKIKDLAKTAVFVAEETLGGDAGKQKKEMAINYIISNLPIIPPLKPLITLILAKFIDETTEFAVQQLKSFAAKA